MTSTEMAESHAIVYCLKAVIAMPETAENSGQWTMDVSGF